MSAPTTEIRRWPDPVLLTPCRPMADPEGGPLMRKLSEHMREVAVRTGAIGLAAPQLGMPGRVLIYLDVTEWHTVVNPEISDLDGSWCADEGCISVPGATVQVERSLSLRLRGFTARGEAIDRVLEGMPARIVQHEVDHLDGLMIVDRVTRQQKRAALRRMDKCVAASARRG